MPPILHHHHRRHVSPQRLSPSPHRHSAPNTFPHRSPSPSAALKSAAKLRRRAMRALRVAHPRHDPVPPPQTALATLPPALPFNLWTRHNRLPPSPSATPTPQSPTPEPWFTAVLLVAFDLDKGQLVESCFPEHALSPAEQDAICYHAMPDSASAASGHEDALYSFRIARHPPTPHQKHPLLFAHTLFRQAPDPSNARGFFQKALVIVSSLCYVTLANVLLTSLASTAFTHGAQALQRAVRDVSSWPDPRLHPTPHTLELPFINHTITLSIPSTFLTSFASPDAILMTSASMSSSDSLSSPAAVDHVKWASSNGAAEHSHSRVAIHAPQLVRMWPLCVSSATASAQPFQEIHLASALQGVHDKLWAIWELVALGEPLLVLGATPSQCASAVMCIIGLIHPLPFLGDWRPYYCIQDTTYATLAAAKDGSMLARGAVYGVTNSHLADTLPFEHVLVLPGAESAGKNLRAGLRTTHKSSLHKARQVSAALQSALSSYVKGSINADQLAQQARDTIYERITKPFLLPFHRYLVPTWSDGSALRDEPNVLDPFGKRLTLIDFDANTFPTLEDVALVCGGNFGKGAGYLKRMRGLYERFVRGAVFDEWWDEARKAAARQCTVLHREFMIEACARGSLLRKMRFEGRPRLAELIERVDKEVEMVDGNDDILFGNLVALTDALKLNLAQSVGDSVDFELDDESTLLLA